MRQRDPLPAAYLGELGAAGAPRGRGEAFTIATGAGPIVPLVLPDGRITVDMGEPVLDGPPCPARSPHGRRAVVDAPLEAAGRAYRVTAVSMGNPHSVAFVDDAGAVDPAVTGRAVEGANTAAFPAEAVNAEFVDVVDAAHVNMVGLGAGCGVTLACGTGACAVAARRRADGPHRADPRRRALPGGPLRRSSGARATTAVSMDGPRRSLCPGHCGVAY